MNNPLEDDDDDVGAVADDDVGAADDDDVAAADDDVAAADDDVGATDDDVAVSDDDDVAAAAAAADDDVRLDFMFWMYVFIQSSVAAMVVHMLLYCSLLPSMEISPATLFGMISGL
jgi:hypothetical protein